MLIQPHELALIQQDHAQLITGPDGCDVILHWLERSGTPDAYGKYTSEIERTETSRAHFAPAGGRQAQRQAPADMQAAEATFLFLPELDLNRPGLWIEVAGIGSYVPVAKPVQAVNEILFSSGQRFVQEVATRVKR